MCAELRFWIIQRSNNIYIFMQVKTNISSTWIKTTLICNPYSFCVLLDIAWHAKCGTHAIGYRPQAYWVSSKAKYVTMLWFHHKSCSSQDSLKGEQQDNKTYRKHKHLESNSYSLKKGKWRAAAVINTLGITKIRSNLLTDQYAGSVSQVLPGVAWHINQVFYKAAKKEGKWTCHTHQPQHMVVIVTECEMFVMQH